MKKTSTLLLLSAVILFSGAAQARNVWKECGIGGMLFKDAKYSWAAISSNIIWDLGTTATSSNVSSDDLCEGSKADVAKLIHENYVRIEEQTVTGQGEQLKAVLSQVGCDTNTEKAILNDMRNSVSTNLKSNEFNQKTTSEKAEIYYNQLMNNASKHAQSCHS